MKSPAVSLFLLAVMSAPAVALDALTAKPVDEASKDPIFKAFRDGLISSVAARDTNAVLAQSCPEILISFGGDGGLDEFREFLTVPEETLSDEYKPQADQIRETRWNELATVLSMGGNFTAEDQFWAPYTFNIQLPDGYDAFTTYFVTGTRVLARRGPDKEADPVANVSNVAVVIEEYDPESEYQAVTFANGRSGYIHRDFLRSVVDYRAGFQRAEDGTWKLCTFVAGD
jgi:hypothetical protein